MKQLKMTHSQHAKAWGFSRIGTGILIGILFVLLIGATLYKFDLSTYHEQCYNYKYVEKNYTYQWCNSTRQWLMICSENQPLCNCPKVVTEIRTKSVLQQPLECSQYILVRDVIQRGEKRNSSRR